MWGVEGVGTWADWTHFAPLLWILVVVMNGGAKYPCMATSYFSYVSYHSAFQLYLSFFDQTFPTFRNLTQEHGWCFLDSAWDAYQNYPHLIIIHENNSIWQTVSIWNKTLSDMPADSYVDRFIMQSVFAHFYQFMYVRCPYKNYSMRTLFSICVPKLFNT